MPPVAASRRSDVMKLTDGIFFSRKVGDNVHVDIEERVHKGWHSDNSIIYATQKII